MMSQVSSAREPVSVARLGKDHADSSIGLGDVRLKKLEPAPAADYVAEPTIFDGQFRPHRTHRGKWILVKYVESNGMKNRVPFVDAETLRKRGFSPTQFQDFDKAQTKADELNNA